MPTTVAQIRSAIKTTLVGIGAEIHATLPGQVSAPAIVIWRQNGPRSSTLGPATFEYLFVATVLTGLADDTSGQNDLDLYVTPTGATSVVEAIHNDVTLGDVVEYAAVRDVERDQIAEYGGISYLAADVLIEVGAN